MRILLILLIIFTSCQNKQETKSNKIPYEPNSNSIENLETGNAQKEKFQKIPYSLKNNYLDSLGTKINPNKNYDYWQYATYYQNSIETKYNVLKQGGDTLLRIKINEKINPIKTVGIFQGGHPNYRCNYAITIENRKVKYVKSEDEFRTFLGNIDNLEEAILLARTYGYLLGSELNESEYRKIGTGFELHLVKYHDYPRSLESVELKIGYDGTIKTKSLGNFRTKDVY
ncbi:hypothetical protein [Flavobacterium sp.]|uniref:hypothetical protein n=1 Tax=Flavobacterium sp. TaxID=239 RepID=UPI002626A3B6|nr:hypothetical protein [Flavobacterium sp.]